MSWSGATVIRNEGVSLDGSVRLLHLSITDHTQMLYGRKVKSVQDPSTQKWVDSYTVPGKPPGTYNFFWSTVFNIAM